VACETIPSAARRCGPACARMQCCRTGARPAIVTARCPGGPRIEDLDAVFGRDLGEGMWIGRSSAGRQLCSERRLARRDEKLLEPRRGIDDQPARDVGLDPIGMRNGSRRQGRVTRVDRYLAMPDKHRHLSPDDVERLIIAVMDVKRRNVAPGSA
jgi:hypothetical protein